MHFWPRLYLLDCIFLLRNQILHNIDNIKSTERVAIAHHRVTIYAIMTETPIKKVLINKVKIIKHFLQTHQEITKKKTSLFQKNKTRLFILPSNLVWSHKKKRKKILISTMFLLSLNFRRKCLFILPLFINVCI